MSDVAPAPGPEQLSLARESRDVALERVEFGADPVWLAAGWAALRARIAQGGEFTTDDLEAPAPREPRVWGALIRKAVVAGWIVNTGRVRPSALARCHARPKTVWRVARLPEHL